MNRARLLLVATMLVACSTLSGCAWSLRGVTPPETPNPSQLMALYESTELGASTSGDVLAGVAFPKEEHVAFSRSAVGIVGPKATADRTWLTLVGFGEESLAASAKYFFLINDRPRAFFYTLTTMGRLDAEQFISPDVLAEDYPDDNARKIAILRDVRNTFNRSAMDLKDEEDRIRSSSMAVNQLLNVLLVELDASPVHAAVLHSEDGLAFRDPTLGNGRVRMDVDGDVVRLTSIVGSARHRATADQPQTRSYKGLRPPGKR